MSEMDKNNFWRLKSFEVRLLVPIINLTPPLCFAKVFLYEHNAKKDVGQSLVASHKKCSHQCLN